MKQAVTTLPPRTSIRVLGILIAMLILSSKFTAVVGTRGADEWTLT